MIKKADPIDIEILEDGRIKVETGDCLTGPAHRQAEEFLQLLATLCGGEVDIKPRKGHSHHHHHAHKKQTVNH